MAQAPETAGSRHVRGSKVPFTNFDTAPDTATHSHDAQSHASNMRLRLSVQRHRLPPTNILWSVPDHVSPQAYTIARLLEDVNTTIPLEAEHWGLEDYAVEVGGFECLHFSPVSQTLKDDDEVT